MWRYLHLAEASGIGIYLFGGTPATLDQLVQVIGLRFPGLRLAGAVSPPFRKPTRAEETAQVEAINGSGAGVVFVGLGCPKQELWMARQRGQIRAVMIGVGAAFDYHAGTVRRAPRWMRRHGLEWLHRLCSDPRRLWRRYLVTNTLFVLKVARQILWRRA
jgi:N-acetylglucosaminyldiphosphoundecaprenol N-acetyl-beta-D-mannosaminyltransferase